MSEINPYLMFNGTCEEAFRYYERHLGARIDSLMKHEGTPAAEAVPDEWREKVLHARMIIGDDVIMASDAPPGRYSAPAGIWISISVQDAGEGERIFNALANGGNIAMAYAGTFWALRFGMVVDRFGIPWMVNVNHPA